MSQYANIWCNVLPYFVTYNLEHWCSITSVCPISVKSHTHKTVALDDRMVSEPTSRYTSMGVDLNTDKSVSNDFTFLLTVS